jgi:hypothetical protein
LIVKTLQKSLDKDRRPRAARIAASPVHPKRRARIGESALKPNSHASPPTGADLRIAIEHASARNIAIPDVIASCSKPARIVLRRTQLADWSGPVALMNELRDPGVSSSQRLFIRQEHDAEVLGAGLLAEAGTVDYHDVLLAD